MTVSDKPSSRLQKYRLTDKGRQWLHKREGEVAPCLKTKKRFGSAAN